MCLSAAGEVLSTTRMVTLGPGGQLKRVCVRIVFRVHRRAAAGAPPMYNAYISPHSGL